MKNAAAQEDTRQQDTQDKASQKGPQGAHKGRRRALVAILVVVLALVLAELGGSYYFSSHFVPGTRVNGRDVSNLTTDELARQAADEAAAWEDGVSGQGFSLTIGAGDIGLTLDGEAYAQSAREQLEPARWVLDLLSPQNVKVDGAVSFDAEKLSALVGSAVEAFNEDATPPTNASVAYGASADAFVIQAESVGTALDAARVEEAVSKDALVLATSTILDESVLEQPQVTQETEALVQAKDEANALLEAGLSLTRDGEVVTTPGRDVLAGWLHVTEDFELAADQDAITAWAGDELADAVAASDETHDYALDTAALASAVASQLEAGDTSDVEIPLEVTATRPEETEGHESRGRHIDINLSTQYARFYDSDGSVIWRSYIVSGNTSTGHGTPTGTYSILAKRRGQTLVGADEDGDGEPDYESYVEYWMPFIGNNYGLHDASWRTNFGGTIYAYAGSHGCVNLPSDAAATLYSLVNVGDTVYLHW